MKQVNIVTIIRVLLFLALGIAPYTASAVPMTCISGDAVIPVGVSGAVMGPRVERCLFMATSTSQDGSGALRQVESFRRDHAKPRAASSFPSARVTGVYTGTLPLQGSIDGNWDSVTGWITFPTYSDTEHLLYVLLRGFDGTLQSGSNYSFGGWNGKLFWIDLGDGVPRLLPAALWNDQYVPGTGELPAQSGRLYLSSNVLYRQAGADYPVTQWADEAAWADLWFVTDENNQLKEISVDLYDDNANYLESRSLAPGDQLQILSQAYDLTDPTIVWMVFYMDFKTLNGQPTISEQHLEPNIDFTDTDLLKYAGSQFDSRALNLDLLLEGTGTDSNDNTVYGYNTPTSLGYTWAEMAVLADGGTLGAASSGSSGGGAMSWLLLLLGMVSGFRYLSRRGR
ncbi:MAG: hypothetical protein R6W80_15740 [Haliea sp.]